MLYGLARACSGGSLATRIADFIIMPLVFLQSQFCTRLFDGNKLLIICRKEGIGGSNSGRLWPVSALDGVRLGVYIYLTGSEYPKFSRRGLISTNMSPEFLVPIVLNPD